MKYRHILRDVDRYGNVRLYFRKKKGDPKIRIDAPPNTPAFNAIYKKLLGGEAPIIPLTKERLQERGYVYFLMTGGLIKIGFTTDAVSRIQGITSSMPTKVDMLIVVPGRLMDEQRLHSALAAHRAKGEWFYPVRTVRMTAIRSAAFCKPTLAVEGPRIDSLDPSAGTSDEIHSQFQ